jgi:hypothetical protein
MGKHCGTGDRHTQPLTPVAEPRADAARRGQLRRVMSFAPTDGQSAYLRLAQLCTGACTSGVEERHHNCAARCAMMALPVSCAALLRVSVGVHLAWYAGLQPGLLRPFRASKTRDAS